jgi:DNA adenine methylase
LADAYARGRGVHGNDTAGTCAARRAWLVEWFGRLRDRLRTVRVCCGDWKRVCWSESVTTRLGVTGIFFDPPYSHSVGRMLAWVRRLRGEGPEPARGRADNRTAGLYSTDGADVDRLVAEVHSYCLERGRDPNYRIALCGYAGEHGALEAEGWGVVAWKGGGGYGNRTETGKENSARERLWFSPHCRTQEGLFDGLACD